MKRRVRLTEQDLRKIVRKSIYDVVFEHKNVKREVSDDNVRVFLNGLTENELQRLEIDYRDVYNPPHFDNPLSFRMTENINEGLVTTYPIDKTIEYIRKQFRLSDKQIQAYTLANGVEFIYVKFPTINDNINQMIKAMSLCGYFLSYPRYEEIPEGEWVEMKFEKKYQEEDTEKIRNRERWLYHLTPIYNVPKIRRIGFAPRSKNSKLDYPERIYFMQGTLSDEEIRILGQQLCNSNRQESNDGHYMLLVLDISKIPESVKFYSDPDAQYCVYTYDNIPPSAIVDSKAYKFNKPT